MLVAIRLRTARGYVWIVEGPEVGTEEEWIRFIT
jgi:hypothetical protein